MRKQSFLLLFILGLLYGPSALAQDGEYVTVRDLESWTSARLNVKWNKHWRGGFTGQVRMDKNSAELKNFFTQANVDRKLFKGFWVTGALRYTVKNDNKGDVQGLDHFIRYQFDATYKHKFKRLGIKYRLRYTNREEMGVALEEGDVHEQNFRLKTSLGYNIKNWKLDPELSGEIFNKYEKDGNDNGFDVYRLTLGTSYKLKGIGKVGVAYRVQRELTDDYPKTTNIIRVKYSYTLKRKTP